MTSLRIGEIQRTILHLLQENAAGMYFAPAIEHRGLTEADASD
jgi:hypothetical protein